MGPEPRDRAAAAFSGRFGQAPQVLVRAPGRVNLIGEHTDYSLLPVLPLAIQRATWVAVAGSEDGRVLAESLQFAGAAALQRDDPLAGVSAPWQRYLAGALLELGAAAAPGRGARVLVCGDLPTGGGLSSSSSLTMGLLAGLDAAWGLRLGPEELLRRGVVAERHVGLESGGMDQTVIALARAGAALRIDFQPAGQRAVPLPPELSLVVADSGQPAPKGGAVQRAYNQRVLGCRMAATLLAAELGLDPGSPPVLGRVAGPRADALLKTLPAEASPTHTATRTDTPLDPLVRLTAGQMDPHQALPVRAVARHVLGEARRVDRAEQALLAGDLVALGALLDQSHASLAKGFGCSTPALDDLCAALRGAGALGARLTGAGFGGHALAACIREAVPAVLQAGGAAAFEVRASDGLRLL